MKVYRPVNYVGYLPCHVYIHRHNAEGFHPHGEIEEVDLDSVENPNILDEKEILATYFFNPPILHRVGGYGDGYLVHEVNVEEVVCMDRKKVVFRLSDQADEQLGEMDHFPTRDECNAFVVEAGR